MAKPRVIIADTDEGYISTIQLKFVKEYFDKIELEIITDKEYFDELFSKPQKADILIVSEELYDVTLQKHNISNIFSYDGKRRGRTDRRFKCFKDV